MRVLDRAMLERLGAALTQQQADLRREIGRASCRERVFAVV